MTARMGKIFGLGKEEKFETKRVGFLLPKPLFKILKKYAFIKGKTMTKIVEEILKKHLPKDAEIQNENTL